MINNFLMNHEEIALVVNYRKLTTRQREMIAFMLGDLANSHSPRISLVVDNEKAPAHALKVVST